MVSTLIITPVEKLQEEIIKAVGFYQKIPGIYVSLNKTQKSIEELLNKNKVDTSKLFFIDCVTKNQTKEETLHITPNNLDNLGYAVSDFVKEIKGKKFLIIDALSTLLIYNSEKAVAAFIKEITEEASKQEVEIIALTPSTKGEELLNKIFNFFDQVKRNKDETKEVRTENNEELIY